MSPQEWEGIVNALNTERGKKEKMSSEEREEYENAVLFGEDTICISGDIGHKLD